MDAPQHTRQHLLICLVLAAATIAVFCQVVNCDFVNFDDNHYVTANPRVPLGITGPGVLWAFTTTHASNWHPLTWLSLMVDSETYGQNPRGFHLTNLLLHVANALLLLLVLSRITGCLWRSTFVAALFAVHPLHVESVAWVAERKDVLSTFFWLLTTWAYVRYAERPGFRTYLLVLLLFVLGLMSKPMLVTLPLTLLLLDYWPLGRFAAQMAKTQSRLRAWTRLVREKIPLFALAGASCVITCIAQQEGGAVRSLEQFPLSIRAANAVVSYVAYIGKMIWPRNLAVFYPHSGASMPIWQTASAGLLLVCISVIAIRLAHRQPYIAVGWLWYLVTLAPVIGLVQVGSQAMADRYTYVPLIGLFIMIAWSVPDLLAGRANRRLKALIAVSAAVVISALMISSYHLVGCWRNSITLFSHAIECTSNNALAHNNLGFALARAGKPQEAIVHYHKALRIKPDYVLARCNLADALIQMGRPEKAVEQCREALRIDPQCSEAYCNLAIALIRQGKLNDAVASCREALRVLPEDPDAHNNLGVALAKQGKLAQAAAHFAKAVQIEPSKLSARANLARVRDMMHQHR